MEIKIKTIKEELQAADIRKLPAFIKKYETDTRTGVKSLLEKAQKKLDAYEKELARTEQMKAYEKKICGA